ncbi:hypothetical protein [Pseudobacillus badius]|uniref:hypothetical protein n=1 Tax=Bacillus badius TaxID=1455 RepID=UPI0007B3A26E|nr:hypothetical protein [Bacillus badius]KZR57896.1 hypothetical protein A3781_19155 [Bacillus badius]
MNTALTNTTKVRLSTQKDTILGMLKKAGDRGVKNTELLKVALRFSGIIHMLRKEGYIIEMKSLGNGVYKYVLVGQETPKVQISAYEKLFDIVAEYPSVTTTQLISLMEQNNIIFKRKATR